MKCSAHVVQFLLEDNCPAFNKNQISTLRHTDDESSQRFHDYVFMCVWGGLEA